MQSQRVDSSKGQQHARLPAIAPRNEGTSLGPQAVSTGPTFQPGSRRSRLPPRSKSGCWTCRTRKVKCDEGRPACGQCTRLGHNCDYNPRLSFRDDTPRVVERMQEVSTIGSSVWDPHRLESSSSRNRVVEDLLPPFSALTTDEDRERKAESQTPGTYHVIANPRSFVSLPEYRDESAATSGSIPRSTHGTFDHDEDSDSLAESDAEDPNTVILKSFDEIPRRGPTLSSNNANSASPASSQISASHMTVSMTQANKQGLVSVSMLDIARNGGRDAHLLQHYRTTISPHIILQARSDRDEDLFEEQARTYPPLFHAMMALAALSNANQNGVRTADALEHYQSVIPALQTTVQSSQDSYSDGALFTHFILLLYEIAAAGDGESNIWQHHIDQLHRIITLRQQAYGIEKCGFIVWTICSIDIYALLSISGTGTIAEALLKQNMLPTPEGSLPPTSPGHPAVIYPEEQDLFPAILKLNQEVTLLGLQVGQLARALRDEAHHRRNQTVSEDMFLMNRKARVQNLHRLIEHSRDHWRSEHPDYWTWLSEPRPPRVFARITHSYMFFRTCMVYSHTCMYPNQLLDLAPESEVEVQLCAAEIIQTASIVISQERFEQHFIVFSLSIAGLATKNSAEKTIAMGIIRTMERQCRSRSIASGRILLEAIYEKQRAATLASGNPFSVDWVQEVELSGLRLIFHGI